MLNHIYDRNLTAPETDADLLGEIMLFDQNPYFVDGSANNYSMNDTGYIYIPSGCTNGTTVCKLHVVFHGCSQYRFGKVICKLNCEVLKLLHKYDFILQWSHR